MTTSRSEHLNPNPLSYTPTFESQSFQLQILIPTFLQRKTKYIYIYSLSIYVCIYTHRKRERVIDVNEEIREREMDLIFGGF